MAFLFVGSVQAIGFLVALGALGDAFSLRETLKLKKKTIMFTRRAFNFLAFIIRETRAANREPIENANENASQSDDIAICNTKQTSANHEREQTSGDPVWTNRKAGFRQFQTIKAETPQKLLGSASGTN